MAEDKSRECSAGVLLILLGGGSAYMGTGYQIGTLTSMGPGFFPTALGVLMALIGIAIFIGAILGSETTEKDEAGSDVLSSGALSLSHLRGIGFIAASIILFIVCAKYCGLLLATFVCVFVASYADRSATLKASLLLAVGITFFGVVLFWYFLSVQIPLVRGYWP